MVDWVLDIDFDFCVTPTLERAHSDRRRQPAGLRLWIGPEEFAEWLEERGLLVPQSFCGAVRQHQEVLAIWQQLLRSGQLSEPFAILHVDGHPDLMDLEPEVERRLQEDTCDKSVWAAARSSDFLQYAVRGSWVERLWMVFPDHRREELAVLANATPAAAAAIVRKPVHSLRVDSRGGIEATVEIGPRLLSVGLFTRHNLPQVPSPVTTVVAQSPEFVPPAADGAFRRLTSLLGGGDV